MAPSERSHTVTPGDVFLLVVRWLHLLAAVAWVGGAVFYLVVLRPAARREGAAGALLQRRVAVEFGVLADTAILVLVLTGAVLAFERLTSPHTGVAYFSVLGVKVALSVWMFLLAHSRIRGRRELFQEPAGASESPRGWRRVLWGLTWSNLLAILGVAVFLLSDLLRALFEAALRRGL